MKKIYTLLTVFTIMLMSIMWTKTTQAQTYADFYADSVVYGVYYDYCASVDSIRLHQKDGETNALWDCGGVYTLAPMVVLASGYQDAVTYSSDQSTLMFYLRHVTLTTSTFTGSTICGIDSVTLDAENYFGYGFTTYVWSDGETTQTVTVGAGTYTVTVTNACGTVSHSATITDNTPNPANIGNDTIICLGDTLTLTSTNTNIISYAWSTTETTPTINVWQTADYSVTTTDNVGCVDVDIIHITVNSPYTGQQVCYVSKGVSNDLNEIFFSQTAGENIVSYNVLKESSVSGVYTLVQNVPQTGTGTSMVVDSSDNGTIQFKYNISIIDSCGNESVLGGAVQPTFLTITVNQVQTYNLHISLYSDANNPPIPTVYIYSGNEFPLTLIDSIAGTNQDYIVPLANTDSIFVTGVHPPCDGGSKSNTIALSNWVKRSQATGIAESNPLIQLVALYPNPVKDMLYIQTDLNIEKMEVCDAVGRCILSTENTMINFSTFSQGCYFIKVTTKQGTIVKKIMH